MENRVIKKDEKCPLLTMKTEGSISKYLKEKNNKCPLITEKNGKSLI